MISLEGKTVLVTGGSRGIGRAVIRLFARAGADCVIGYLQDRKAAEQVQGEVLELGRRAVIVGGDVSQAVVVEELFARGVDAFGGIDIVVGNAGIWKRAPIDEMSEEQWDETIEINLKSVFLTCRAAVREMKRRRQGCIILVSSTAGQRGEAFYSHYAATKGAIIALTKSLAPELGSYDIRINAVAPGWVLTDMSAEVFSDPEYTKTVESEIPLGRIASAEDIAGPILYLASDLAGHIHGEVINVNGGSVLCG